MVEVFQRPFRVSRRMETRDDLLPQQHLEIARVPTTLGFAFEPRNLFDTSKRQQLEVAPHERVRDAHQLAEHVGRLLANADVVVLRLRHLLDAVQPFQQRHGQDALLLLAVLLLQFAANQQIELLVRAAELEIGVQRNRVVTLHERVQQLVNRDGHAALVALSEILALKNPRDGVTRRKLDHAVSAERHGPLAVVAHLGLLTIQHERGLLEIGLRVRLDLLARQRRARGVTPRRVPDQRSEVANQEDHRMAKILQLTHLVQDNRMANMNIRRGRVEAKLDAQGLAARGAASELLCELGFDQQLVTTPFRDGKRGLHFVGEGQGFRSQSRSRSVQWSYLQLFLVIYS